MDGTGHAKSRILDINRDSEVLNQFVRINLDEQDDSSSILEGDQKDPLKAYVSHKAELLGNIKRAHEEPPEKKHLPKQQQNVTQESEEPLNEENQQPQENLKEEVATETENAEQQTKTSQKKFKSKRLQRELYKELRKRKKKRKRPKPEEIYTDKDRAAAVNMGTRDIKHSLKMKRREERTRMLQLPEEAEPSTFLALGNCEISRGDPSVGLMFLNKALELNPAEKNSLVARSRCYLLLGQPENGLKDAEAALAVDKNFMKAIYQKAEALYYLGDFEHSLMYYHRGLRIRPEHEGFQLGVHKAQKAIENAIGGAFPGTKRSPAVSSRRKSLSSKSRTRESATTSSKATSTKNNSPEPKMSEFTPVSSQKNHARIPRARTANRDSRLLGELKTDKEYLENLLNHPHLKCKNKEDDSEVIGYVQEAVDFLNTRQEFWRQQFT